MTGSPASTNLHTACCQSEILLNDSTKNKNLIMLPDNINIFPFKMKGL